MSLAELRRFGSKKTSSTLNGLRACEAIEFSIPNDGFRIQKFLNHKALYPSAIRNPQSMIRDRSFHKLSGGWWAALRPGGHGTSQRNEASKGTEGQIWSRIPVSGYKWNVESRAGPWGTDTDGAFNQAALGLDIDPPCIRG
jgi:hypothetical protein